MNDGSSQLSIEQVIQVMGMYSQKYPPPPLPFPTLIDQLPCHVLSR